MRFVFSLQLFILFFSQTLLAEEWIIGLDADMSNVAAQGGKSIYEGAQIAVDEINALGGVLGQPFKIIVKDHRGNPSRGKDNINAFAEINNLVAVIGGVHTPVAMNELKAVHKHQIPFLIPWAAGTPIIENGFSPNFVFRVSVRDEYAGPFLMNEAKARGYKKVALFLERTGWGRSNEKSMVASAENLGIEVVQIKWFNWGEKSFTRELDDVIGLGAEVALLVANAPEGAVFVKDLAELPEEKRLPILSHWGITGGLFADKVGLGTLNMVDLNVLQTFSFANAKNALKRDLVLNALKEKFRPDATRESVRSPVGIAHAYDLVHLLSEAIKIAGKGDRTLVQSALKEIKQFEGLMRTYNEPFSGADQEGLGPEDFQLGKFNSAGYIVPVTQ